MEKPRKITGPWRSKRRCARVRNRSLRLENLEPRQMLSLSAAEASVRAGDYNQNGMVDTADYVLWRAASIQRADGHLDGVVDQLDLDVWRSNFGKSVAEVRREWPYLLEHGKLYQQPPGQRDFIAADVRHWALDPQDHLVFLDFGGVLWRSQEPFGAGNWQELARDVVQFDITEAGRLLTRHQDGWFRIDGASVWSGTNHFLTTGDHIYWLGNSGELKQLQQGQWQDLSAGVSWFSVTPAGRVVAQHSDGSLRIDSVVVGYNTKQVSVEPDGVFWLTTTGELRRLPYGGNWQVIGDNVVRFAVTSAGRVLTQHSDSSFRIDGVGVWTNTSEFLVTEDGIYWLGTTGEFKHLPFGGNWQTWSTDATGVTSLQPGLLGEIYMRRSNGELRRYFQGDVVIQTNVENFVSTSSGELQVVLPQGTTDQETLRSYPAGPFREILSPSNQPVSSALLNPVGLIRGSDGRIGSGTNLDSGIVITAKHVVAGLLPSQLSFTFQIRSSSLFPVEVTRPVTKIVLHPELDIALLKIGGDTRGLPTASLPSPGRGWNYAIPGGNVLLAGYGYSGDGFRGEQPGTAGTKRYGFAKIDRSALFPSSQYPGPHWVNVYRQGESAFARGDSGGPDIVPYVYTTRPPSGSGIPVQKLTVPVVVGVHSFLTRPKAGGGYVAPPERPNGTLDLRYGDEMWSVAVTPALVNWYFQQRFGLIFGGSGADGAESTLAAAAATPAVEDSPHLAAVEIPMRHADDSGSGAPALERSRQLRPRDRPQPRSVPLVEPELPDFTFHEVGRYGSSLEETQQERWRDGIFEDPISREAIDMVFGDVERALKRFPNDSFSF